MKHSKKNYVSISVEAMDCQVEHDFQSSRCGDSMLQSVLDGGDVILFGL